ncbi:hypothetical protein QYF61_025394 [Mycteria americana]|uniref:Uncharacterized protein n=1 Tax=Mycteria americana TaxID=33587 RepID=A0AAN7RZX3_MYCAM|nr:hypothetical protein QYF61_025394 [Mycteria americana]
MNSVTREKFPSAIASAQAPIAQVSGPSTLTLTPELTPTTIFLHCSWCAEVTGKFYGINGTNDVQGRVSLASDVGQAVCCSPQVRKEKQSLPKSNSGYKELEQIQKHQQVTMRESHTGVTTSLLSAYRSV